VVEEDQPEREPAKKVEPQIAFGRNRGHERLFFLAAFQP
jgi:hypothetical protein